MEARVCVCVCAMALFLFLWRRVCVFEIAHLFYPPKKKKKALFIIPIMSC